MENDELVRALDQLSEQLKGFDLSKLNAAPAVAPAAPVTPDTSKGVEDQATSSLVRRGLISSDDMGELRDGLRKMTDRQLHRAFAAQAIKKDQGIPFDLWANAGGHDLQRAIERSNNPELVKALDSAGASALIRQDLEPVLYELYVRQFPFWERVSKEPANGLVHAYDQITSYGAAKFMAELGTVTDDVNTYNRATTNVAVAATRRGISLKSQYAVLQGGAGFNPEQLELTGGLRAIAATMQKALFSGTVSTSDSGDGTTETGFYDENGFNGLRYLLKSNSANQNADVLAATPADIRAAISKSSALLSNLGAAGSVLWGNPLDKDTFDVQQDKNVRYMNQLTEVAVGVMTNVVNTVFGPLPFATVPGNAIGEYNPASAFSAATKCRDIYLLDEGTISCPYLGSDGPTVLDIPIGISGQLTHMFIIFGMWGFAVKAPTFSSKIRIRTA